MRGAEDVDRQAWSHRAVLVDEDGTILSGHHRAQAADELGVDYPTKTIAGMTEDGRLRRHP